jgi:polysaccharide biosynthesis/export protein
MSRQCHCRTIWLAALIAGSVAGAQEAPYLIGPGDTLAITVTGAPELTGPVSVTVRPDGAISFPWVDELKAGGKTVVEVADALTTALGRRYAHVGVTVNVTTFHQRAVFVLGEVLKGGPVPVQGDTISTREAVAAAGGLTPEASESGARLYRAGRPVSSVDLSRAMAGEGEGASLQVGDILVVEKRDQITVLGEVTTRGIHSLPPDARLSSLLALTGPVTERGDARRAILVRGDGQTTIVDLEYLMAHPESPINVPVAGYRTFVVPPKQDVLVAGEVKTPGARPAAAGTRLLEAVMGAGGLLDGADARHVTVIDRNNQSRVIDLEEVIAHPESEANLPVDDLALILVGKDRTRFEVAVLGEVALPKNVPAQESIPLAAALAGAGGLKPSADPHRVQIVRKDGTQQVVDAAALVGATAGGAPPEAAVMVGPGDLVIVARRYARVLVLGAVNEPGTYEFDEGDLPIDAVAKASGFAPKALKKETSVLRRAGDGVEVYSLNLKAGLRGSDELLRVPLKDRDIVYVPQGKVPVWAQLSSLFFGAEFIRRVLMP